MLSFNHRSNVYETQRLINPMMPTFKIGKIARIARSSNETKNFVNTKPKPFQPNPFVSVALSQCLV